LYPEGIRTYDLLIRRYTPTEAKKTLVSPASGRPVGGAKKVGCRATATNRLARSNQPSAVGAAKPGCQKPFFVAGDQRRGV
jgi:hypothetical protein